MDGFFADFLGGLMFSTSIVWAVGGFILMIMYIFKVLPKGTGSRLANMLLVLICFIACFSLPWKAVSFMIHHLDSDSDDGFGSAIGVVLGLFVIGPLPILLIIKFFSYLSEKRENSQNGDTPSRPRKHKSAPKNRNSHNANQPDSSEKWQKFADHDAFSNARERFYTRNPPPKNTKHSRNSGRRPGK